jgi:hypothetical protein
MFHPVILGVLGGALIARVVLRRRRHAYGCGGGGMGYRGRRFFRREARWTPPEPAVKLSTLIGALELNARQKEEFDEVLKSVKTSVGADNLEAWPGLGPALRVVGGDSFDRERLDGLPPEAIDGFEHLHNILTPEQRDQLRAAAR